MKQLFTIYLFVLLISSNLFAQANKNWDGTKPEIYEGSKCFVFTYSPFVSAKLEPSFAGFANFTTLLIDTNNISSISSLAFSKLYGIGFKYYVNKKFDMNIGLNVGNASIEEQKTSTGGATVTNKKYSATTFGISLDGNYRLRTLYNISPYVGVNINFSTLSATETNVSGATFTDEISGTTFGAGLNFGFDWFFTPGLSVGGKYTFGFVNSSGLDETVKNPTSTITIKYPKLSGFGTGTASIMLNVHF